MAKLLFIENDRAFDEMYQRKFVASGFDFEIAASKVDALQKISDVKFDVILLEIALEDNAGLDILKELRVNHHIYGTHLKVIIFSDSSDRDLHMQATALGVNGFIAKLAKNSRNVPANM